MKSPTAWCCGNKLTVSSDFEQCLERKKLFPSSRAKNLVAKELSAAEEDYREAEDRFRNQRYKYATITAYYSTFHSVRALVFSKGYRERSHQCLRAALQRLFVSEGLLDSKWDRAFLNTMSLREDADYATEYSQEGAEIALKHAKGLLEAAKRILNRK